MITWIDVGNVTAIIFIIGGMYWLWHLPAAVYNRHTATTNLIQAQADRERSHAGRVIAIPGVTHQAMLYDGYEWTVQDIKPAPTEISFDEKTIRNHALELINESIAAQNGNGDAQQVKPEAETHGSINYFWKETTDYMAEKGWIVKKEKQPTVCQGTITLSVIRRALMTRAI